MPTTPVKEIKTWQLTENFHIREFACNDGHAVPTELVPNVIELAKNLQILRDYLGEPLHINSGYRTPIYNSKIGGAKNSQHLLAKAADCTTKNKTSKELFDIIEKLIKEKKMKQGGLGLYKGFVHYDIRNKKSRWAG